VRRPRPHTRVIAGARAGGGLGLTRGGGRGRFGACLQSDGMLFLAGRGEQLDASFGEGAVVQAPALRCAQTTCARNTISGVPAVGSRAPVLRALTWLSTIAPRGRLGSA